MSPLEQLLVDLASLNRPKMPYLAHPDSAARREWVDTLAAWQLANPAGDARYCELLEQITALEKARDDEKAKRERLASWGERYRLPRRVSLALENPRPSQAMDAVTRWMGQPKIWCVLMGATGLGKSVAAAWALHRCFEQGSRVAWMAAAEIASAAGGFSGQETADRLKSVDVLVVDDLGTEHTNEWSTGVLRDILQSRHEDQLRTVLTTNLSGADFRAHVGKRLADRIRGECVAVTLDGQSMRPEATP